MEAGREESGLGLTKQQLEAFSAAIDRQISYTKGREARKGKRNKEREEKSYYTARELG